MGRIYFTFGFISSVFYFAVTFLMVIVLTGMTVAYEMPREGGAVMSPAVFIIAFIIATAAVFLITSVMKKPIIIGVLFYFALLAGLWSFATTMYRGGEVLVFFIGFILLYALYRSIFIHNAVVIIAIAAFAVRLGIGFDPWITAILICALAVYDYIAVHKTKHMVGMATGLMDKKVFMGVLIPATLKDMGGKLRSITIDSLFLFIGSGDIFMPAMLVASSLRWGLVPALWTSAGALSGFVLLYRKFALSSPRTPRAGLPLIITGAIAGFLVGYLVSLA